MKKKVITQKQKQSQKVIVNLVMAKHYARRKPSGKRAQPIIYQPPIRMIQSYGDVLARQPPQQQILGEDFRKIIKEEIKTPVSELREEFLSRVESKPKEQIIDEPEFLQPIKVEEGERVERNPFEIMYDGATLEMLLTGNYGLTNSGRQRTTPTKRQQIVINKYKNM